MVNHLRRGGCRVDCTAHPTRRAQFCQCTFHTHERAFGSRFNMCVVLFAQKQSSSFLVVMSLLNIDEHTLSSFWSTPSGPLLNFPSPLEQSRITAAAPIRGSLAEWQTGPQTQVMSPTSDSTSIRSSKRSAIKWTITRRKHLLSISDHVAHGRSQTSCRKSAANTVLTVIGSSVDGSWKRECDCVSETSVFSFNKTWETGVKICGHD